ncbi:MAG: RNA pseudouridine synthase [Desulfoplanes sp.]|nr:RNA pseudouridine synthase [Desulfoplanes sp.]MDD4648944.1 RNA pseudouridine synthase [Desulfoplanes sp.]
MQENHKKFKAPPKKYQPRGISVLYEDYDILVVDKMSGLLSVSTVKIRDNTAYNLLTNYVRRGNQKAKNKLFVVHRLDRETSGILMFAKTEEAKRYLMDDWHDFVKKYYAVVEGILPEKEGIITSYLAENSAFKMYSVKDSEKGAFAKTGFKVLQESKKYSLLEIELFTGKKNQIRVHFSEKGFPVVGDSKYGKKERGIERMALHATSLTLIHPITREKMTFESKMPEYFTSLMRR